MRFGEVHGDAWRATRLVPKGEDQIHDVVVALLILIAPEHANGIPHPCRYPGLLHDEDAMREPIISTIFVAEGLNRGNSHIQLLLCPVGDLDQDACYRQATDKKSRLGVL